MLTGLGRVADGGRAWHHVPLMDTPDPLAPLRAFRDALYACFDRRADALVELADAVLATGPVPSLPPLSLVPLHRRRWGSVYDALAAGRLSACCRTPPLPGCVRALDADATCGMLLS